MVLDDADPGARRAHHDARQQQPEDMQRVAIIKAERALIVLETMVECADLSDVALDRIVSALQDVYDALQLKRRARLTRWRQRWVRDGCLANAHRAPGTHRRCGGSCSCRAKCRLDATAGIEGIRASPGRASVTGGGRSSGPRRRNHRSRCHHCCARKLSTARGVGAGRRTVPRDAR